MKIQSKSVVSISYVLKDDAGNVLDESSGEDLVYMHGTGRLLDSLEQKLEGREAGEKLSVRLTPEEAYGARDADKVRTVKRALFEGLEPEVGSAYSLETDQGMQTAVVVKIDGDDVTIDMNHPLAGMNLNFDITIDEVREPTAEELKHGHAHPHGYCEDDDDDECCCHHHHDGDDDDHDHCCCGHHHHDDDGDHDHCCHHHDHDDDDHDGHDHCCHHHHHDGE